MCGIVGAVAERPVADILLQGLIRLEYRGYDSAGIAILHPKTYKIQRIRVKGKVTALVEKLKKSIYKVTQAFHIRAGQPMENRQKTMHIPTVPKTVSLSCIMASLKIMRYSDKNF